MSFTLGGCTAQAGVGPRAAVMSWVWQPAGRHPLAIGRAPHSSGCGGSPARMPVAIHKTKRPCGRPHASEPGTARAAWHAASDAPSNAAAAKNLPAAPPSVAPLLQRPARSLRRAGPAALLPQTKHCLSPIATLRDGCRPPGPPPGVRVGTSLPLHTLKDR
ncbi:MAG: hypothetical protein J3K34DRAFT_410440 [Monoraphidium minutum]|nr:MAG: hypothetical protein J3K34DRAFT_410440 [Monoraphidium minutum]